MQNCVRHHHSLSYLEPCTLMLWIEQKSAHPSEMTTRNVCTCSPPMSCADCSRLPLGGPHSNLHSSWLPNPSRDAEPSTDMARTPYVWRAIFCTDTGPPRL